MAKKKVAVPQVEVIGDPGVRIVYSLAGDSLMASRTRFTEQSDSLVRPEDMTHPLGGTR
jgi:hypothetical protein